MVWKDTMSVDLTARQSENSPVSAPLVALLPLMSERVLQEGQGKQKGSLKQGMSPKQSLVATTNKTNRCLRSVYDNQRTCFSLSHSLSLPLFFSLSLSNVCLVVSPSLYLFTFVPLQSMKKPSPPVAIMNIICICILSTCISLTLYIYIFPFSLFFPLSLFHSWPVAFPCFHSPHHNCPLGLNKGGNSSVVCYLCTPRMGSQHS